MRNKFGIKVPEALELNHQEHERHDTAKCWDYCKIDAVGQVEEVSCKCCGSKIMGPRDWGDPEIYKANDEANTVIVKQRVRIMPYNNYTMVLLDMGDGAMHLTTCCTGCEDALRAATPEQLHDYYVSDLASLASTAATERDMAVVAKLHERKPKQVL